MQNQIALYLIFITGVTLLYAAIVDWDFILGPKRDEPENKEMQARLPLFTSMMHTLMHFLFFWNWFIPKKKLREDKMTYLNHDRKNKRVFYGFLGLIIIILGIIALNSGKFS